MNEGNSRLREMSALQAREKLRALFTGDPRLKENYYRWLERYQDGKATYTSEWRGLIQRKRPT